MARRVKLKKKKKKGWMRDKVVKTKNIEEREREREIHMLQLRVELLRRTHGHNISLDTFFKKNKLETIL